MGWYNGISAQQRQLARKRREARLAKLLASEEDRRRAVPMGRRDYDHKTFPVLGPRAIAVIVLVVDILVVSVDTVIQHYFID